MKNMNTNRLPASGPQRELLRTKGQFWTPDWVAEFMVAFVLQNKPLRLLDPALGNGVFFLAAKRYAKINYFEPKLFGCDIDPEVLREAQNAGLGPSDLGNVELRDFVLDPPTMKFPAIVANPPYIRHHRLPYEIKLALREYAFNATGLHIDGRAGLHVYFLIRALQCLEEAGRLAYIVSADIVEGVFADRLWQWVCSKYKLESVITFSSKSVPFPSVDTNALVFLISNDHPLKTFNWVKCHKRSSEDLIKFIHGDKSFAFRDIEVHERLLEEGLSTGLSRPVSNSNNCKFVLKDFATVMRGIVTGDNEFFFMTMLRAQELGIPDQLLLKAIGRTRDVNGNEFCPEDVQRLEKRGRPTRLLYLNGLSYDDLPVSVRNYLHEGETRGISRKTLIKTRNPWYRMEQRETPPILFAYLGRRSIRFIRNRAKVVPLTCFLCIYPRSSNETFINKLWNVLSHPSTVDNLRIVGKSYGRDAIKVEPRALERLPLPENVVNAEGLASWLSPRQSDLFR